MHCIVQYITKTYVYFRYGLQLYDPEGFDGALKCRVISKNVGMLMGQFILLRGLNASDSTLLLGGAIFKI